MVKIKILFNNCYYKRMLCLFYMVSFKVVITMSQKRTLIYPPVLTHQTNNLQKVTSRANVPESNFLSLLSKYLNPCLCSNGTWQSQEYNWKRTLVNYRILQKAYSLKLFENCCFLRLRKYLF